MFPSACSFIVCWFSLSFTTCFGLHGHLQVWAILHIFIFICLNDSASLPFFTYSHFACFPIVFCSCAVLLRYFCCFLACVFVCLLFLCCLFVLSDRTDKHTCKETNKMTKENSTGTKHKWKICRVWPCEKEHIFLKSNTPKLARLFICLRTHQPKMYLLFEWKSWMSRYYETIPTN
jgi:hypothetical protein